MESAVSLPPLLDEAGAKAETDARVKKEMALKSFMV